MTGLVLPSVGSQEVTSEPGSRPIYVERVNAVIDYIESHLGEELTLERLAEVAHFSPYHFHRVFSVLVGETLGRFINRVRLEHAATLLVQRPDESVTSIASSCGFTNPSSFSRAFAQAFGMTPTEWRESGYLRYERRPGEELRDVVGNLGIAEEDYGILDTSIDFSSGSATWDVRAGSLGEVKVSTVRIPEMEVAYVRFTGRYQGDSDVFTDLFTRLMTWAQPRDLVGPGSRVLAVYHDNPSITEDDKLRVSACITIPPDTQVSGEVGRMTLAGGLFAVAEYELGVTDYPEAWYTLAGGWLPDSGYEPDDRLPFEEFPTDRQARDPDRHPVNIWLPVRPLRRL